jgi:predicted phage terminase large subunit-like protein
MEDGARAQLLLDRIVSGLDCIEAVEDALAVLPALAEASPAACAAYSRLVRGAAEAMVVACGTDVGPAGRALDCVEDVLRLNAAHDFDSYMLFMEWGREPSRQFYRPRRRVLLPLVADLQDLFDGRLDFLSISMPPRTGKSTLCIFFLTFVMGSSPLKANVMSGHSDKLTKGFHMEALSIITDADTYRFAEVFPGAPVVASSMAEETINLARRSRFPTLTCRSIEGTLTGAVEVGRGALLYCDDLVSDREEALSSERMDKLYAAYLNQLKDRMNDGARQLFVATRWVPNDPIGRIEEHYGGNPRYRFTVMPALGEDGETNFDYLYGLGFSTAYYEDMRDSLEAAGEGDSWAAKYMGEPYWIGGLMFPREELRLYDELPEGEPDAVIAVCDTKDRGKDYAVMPIGYVYGDDHYIEAAVCDNGLPEAVEPRLASALARHGVGIAQFESNSAGGRVADSVGEKCRELGHPVDIRKRFSTTNKETRILVDSGWVKARCLFRAEPPDPDYARFMSMLVHYTTEGRNRHDDAPDAMSMYKRLATSLPSARVEAFRRPW